MLNWQKYRHTLLLWCGWIQICGCLQEVMQPFCRVSYDQLEVGHGQITDKKLFSLPYFGKRDLASLQMQPINPLCPNRQHRNLHKKWSNFHTKHASRNETTTLVMVPWLTANWDFGFEGNAEMCRNIPQWKMTNCGNWWKISINKRSNDSRHWLNL